MLNLVYCYLTVCLFFFFIHSVWLFFYTSPSVADLPFYPSQSFSPLSVLHLCACPTPPLSLDPYSPVPDIWYRVLCLYARLHLCARTRLWACLFTSLHTSAYAYLCFLACACISAHVCLCVPTCFCIVAFMHASVCYCTFFWVCRRMI